jgi:hypothetical protein
VRRAWKCMRCPEDSAFIGQRFRVETHILREHLTPEFDSPFSCLLCKFACLKYKELERHINHYQPHQILRREAIKEGLYTSDSAYFITNPSPIHFTDSDCCILSRDDSTKQYQKIPTLPLPLSTNLNFDKTEKFISELTAYCPTFGPLSPIANDNQFDVEAVLDSLQDQEADVCVVPNQLVLGNTTISTQNVSDESNIKVTNATCIDFLATPPCSPVIGTPDLPSPIRQIILNDRESEPTDSLDILPQILGTHSNIDNSQDRSLETEESL